MEQTTIPERNGDWINIKDLNEVVLLIFVTPIKTTMWRLICPTRLFNLHGVQTAWEAPVIQRQTALTA
jgi:hypothetical protein